MCQTKNRGNTDQGERDSQEHNDQRTNCIELRPVFSDGIVPVGIVMGYAILVLTFLLTLIYVWIANAYFEPLEKKIIAELER